MIHRAVFIFIFSVVAARAAQLPDGRIVFSAAEGKLRGQAARNESKVKLRASGDGVSWTFKPTRWGMYDIELTAEGVGGLEVEVAGKRFNGSKARTIGRVYVAKSEPFSVTITSK